MARRAQPVNRHWTGFDTGTVGTPLAAGTVAGMVHAATHDRETLLRTRGTLLSYVDTASAPGDLALICVGMILVPEGTGTTVLWSPFTDSDAPWFYFTSFFVGTEEMVTDVIDVPGITSYRETIDSKGMRRMRNQEIQVVMENSTILNATPVNIVLAGRMLTQE